MSSTSDYDEQIAATRAYWDSFSRFFQERMEVTTLQLARTLASMLRLPEATAVLEVGAGAGGGAQQVLPALSEGARFVVSDLSPEMVALARAVLPERVEVQQADACQLPFADQSFDRLMANLNLMLVPAPEAALAEAARVLRPGGRAGWSVWGRREQSPMFTLAPRVAQEVGIELPEAPRSNFDLGERESLREQVRASGFREVLAWYQPMVRDVGSGSAYVETLAQTPRWAGILAGVSAEQDQAFRETLAARVDERLAAGKPIQLDALIAVADR